MRFVSLMVLMRNTDFAYSIDAEKVNVTPEGRAALLRLSKGDMRRALNVLQVHSHYF